MSRGTVGVWQNLAASWKEFEPVHMAGPDPQNSAKARHNVKSRFYRKVLDIMTTLTSKVGNRVSPLVYCSSKAASL